MASTELRVAAQQALQALLDDCLVQVGPHSWERRSELAITALKTALAEPVQEPVAWRFEARHIDSAWAAAVTLKHPGPEGVYMRNVVPLYTAPPQRKPLTEEEIADAANSVRWSQQYHVDFARAIERAHGIGGAPEERHFCPRCGKRSTGIHTCTPPAPLTDEVIAELWHQNGGFHHHFARAIERWLRGHA